MSDLYIAGAIKLDEDRVGVSETAVYIHNLLHCVGVGVKLNRDSGVPCFLGMHIFGSTTSQRVDFMLQYVRDTYVGGCTVAEVVVCLNRDSLDTYKVKSQELLDKVGNAFGQAPRILHKPEASTDMWLRVPTAANSPWIRTRSPTRDDYHTIPEANSSVRKLRADGTVNETLTMVVDFPVKFVLTNPSSSLGWKDINTAQLPFQ